jgi:hypothetical protein
MIQPAGYSETPLAKKLGIKSGFTIRLIAVPDYYFELFSDFPEKVIFSNEINVKKDLIHSFVLSRELLDSHLVDLKKEIVPNGSIWISWYKKSAKMNTNVTEDFIRNKAIENGLVDVKVCALNHLWSALKLVIPVKNRK